MGQLLGKFRSDFSHGRDWAATITGTLTLLLLVGGFLKGIPAPRLIGVTIAFGGIGFIGFYALWMLQAALGTVNVYEHGISGSGLVRPRVSMTWSEIDGVDLFGGHGLDYLVLCRQIGPDVHLPLDLLGREDFVRLVTGLLPALNPLRDALSELLEEAP